MEYDCAKLIIIIDQLFLGVFSLEEARIREPRRDHLAIAFFNRLAAVGGNLVSDNNIMSRELARFRVSNRKGLLVRFQRQANDLIRKLKEFFVHIAQNHNGPFREARDFIKQANVFNQL